MLSCEQQDAIFASPAKQPMDSLIAESKAPSRPLLTPPETLPPAARYFSLELVLFLQLQPFCPIDSLATKSRITALITPLDGSSTSHTAQFEPYMTTL